MFRSYWHMNQRRGHVLGISLAILASLPAWPANASWLKQQRTKFLAMCVAALEPLVQENVVDFSGRKIKITGTKNAEPATITLAKRLGGGFFGSVYVIKKSDAPRLGGPFKGALTAKIMHYAKNLEQFGELVYVRGSTARELANFEFLAGFARKIAADPRYPRDSAWKDGVLPVVPILSAVHTDFGLVLVKPLMEGHFLKDIGRIIRDNGGKIPPEIEKALVDVFNYVQATYAQVKHADGSGYNTDIRPPNLIWVFKPELLELFQMRKPGIVLFEQDEVPLKQTIFIEATGDITLRMWLDQYRQYALDAAK